MEGVFRRRDHADPCWVDRELAAGRLISLYSGVLIPAGKPIDLSTLVTAARLVDPDAVVIGEGARSLGWAGNPVTSLRLASKRRLRGGTEYLSFTERSVPLDFVIDREEVRFTSPEYTAVDLVPTHGAGAVIELLREARDRGDACLSMMWQALATMRRRPGIAQLRHVLRECERRPWSEAERELHNLLRSNGFDGWEGNYRIQLEDTWVLDVAFEEEQVGLEFDSRQFHSDSASFERDRLKVNQLQDAEWKIFLVTSAMLAEEKQLLGWISRALGRARTGKRRK